MMTAATTSSSTTSGKQQYWTTSFSPTGNRYAEHCNGGSIITIQKQAQSDARGRLDWVVGSQTTGGEMLGHFSSNEVIRFSSANVEAEATWTGTRSTRPLVAVSDDGSALTPVVAPSSGSLYSNAIPIASLNATLYVDSNQVLQLQKGDGTSVALDSNSIVDPLIDAHITYSAVNKMWALYTSSTTQRYDHGILGDRAEGFHLHVLKQADGQSTLEVANEIVLTDDNDIVFEDLAPVWTDIDRDGIDDLLTTIATRGQGAAMRAYLLNADGSVKGQVQSAYIGTGNRWLHKIAHAPMGPNGEWEIVDCRTPHIGGIIRYFRYDAARTRLSEVTRISSNSYTSHLINSRNIDQAVVADLNGDGTPELVIQTQRRDKLVGLQRTSGDDGDAQVVWCVPLDASIRSNLAVSCAKDGAAQLVFGTTDNQVYTVTFAKNATMGPNITMGDMGTAAPVTGAASCPSCMTQLHGFLSLFLVVYHLWMY